MNIKSFRRSSRDKWIWGICGGLSPILGGIPSWVIRLALILLVLGTRVGFLFVIAYIVTFFAVPEEDVSVSYSVDGQPTQATVENMPGIAGRPWLLLGLVLIAAGAVILCREIWGIDLQKYLFPAFLVIAGVMVLFMAAGRKKP